MDGIFAGTPPPEALRCLIHEAASIRAKEDLQEKAIMTDKLGSVFAIIPVARP